MLFSAPRKASAGNATWCGHCRFEQAPGDPASGSGHGHSNDEQRITPSFLRRSRFPSYMVHACRRRHQMQLLCEAFEVMNLLSKSETTKEPIVTGEGNRRRALLLLLALPLLAADLQPVHADDVTIDRRVRHEDRSYALTFAAKAPGSDSDYGHAYIIWQREDDSKQMSVADAIGFHAIREKEATKVEKVFGTPGYLKNDVGENPAIKLTVLVNSDVYQKALDRKLEWQREDSEYYALWNNCVGHVAAIAQAVGLTTSSGNWVTPTSYLEDLTNRNRDIPTPTPAAPAPTPAPMSAPTPAPKAAPAIRPAPLRRTGPGPYDRGWGNGAGNGGRDGMGGGGFGGGAGGWQGTIQVR
jgi:hypothetical protein